MIREGAKEGTFAPGRGTWPPWPIHRDEMTMGDFLQEMIAMGSEKLESWEFCLSKTKQDRVGYPQSGRATAMKIAKASV